jgi:hypothetical protein
LVLNSADVTSGDPVYCSGYGLVLVHGVDEGLGGDGALTTVSVEPLLFFGSPVREEVMADSGGVLLVGVPFLDEFVNVGEVLETHVEFLKGSVGLVLFGQVLHELEGGVVEG